MEAFADISAGMDVDWDSGVFCAAMRSPRFPVYFHDYDIVQFSGVLRTTMISLSLRTVSLCGRIERSSRSSTVIYNKRTSPDSIS